MAKNRDLPGILEHNGKGAQEPELKQLTTLFPVMINPLSHFIVTFPPNTVSVMLTICLSVGDDIFPQDTGEHFRTPVQRPLASQFIICEPITV